MGLCKGVVQILNFVKGLLLSVFSGGARKMPQIAANSAFIVEIGVDAADVLRLRIAKRILKCY